ncbi:hypothetical protein BST11_22555 [Mycobacterium alsense]|uniref:DUF2510 domain-containing protein n=1 Tax=Mycobacterium alsense TaxID=324058 RepID=A0AA42C1D9_9MYCO|nr:DUF2510 domain-containing protein [Mycobacterium alsense]MCV7381683.1 DUF2510 domain-containing protein [Mycobacterium alsense]OQZ88459.1 hypothetical protein BST11_22555 [Mycobacterium alsense]
MTSQQAPAGWYPDPNGGSGQMYWDGQQWSSPTPAAPQQPGISQDALRAAMAENRSIWVTGGLALWSLICGIIGAITDLFCGVGIGPSGIGLVLGVIAFNKSKQTGEHRGLALTALIVNAVAFGIGLIVMLVIFGGLGSMGS